MTSKQEKALNEYIEKAFARDGWLQQQGFNHSQEQLQYAQQVSNWLTGNPEQPVGLIEAETGTGKTLGYLIPLLSYLALTGKRGAISTYTIALQRQMITGDLKTAQRFLIEMKLPRVTDSQRLGRAHFVDPSRVELEFDLLEQEGQTISPQHYKFLEWAQMQREDGSGLFSDWHEREGKLPEWLSEHQLCLVTGSEEDTNIGYRKHKEKTVNSQLVITSHAMLFQNLRTSGGILAKQGELPLSVILCDEADHLQHAAESLSYRRLQPAAISRLCNKVLENISHTSSLGRTINQLTRDTRDLNATIKQLGDNYRSKPCILIRETNDKQVKTSVTAIKKLLPHFIAIEKSFTDARTKKPKKIVRIACQELLQMGDWLSHYGTTQDRYDGLSWSDHYRRPSISSISYLPGRRIRQYLTGNTLPACRIMLTSATLSSGQTQHDPYINIRSELGIASHEVACRFQITPKKFGNMAFVLTDPALPSPFNKKGSNKIKFNQAWLNYLTRMILKAGSYGNCLVLTNSFSETEAIFRRMKNKTDTPLLHVHTSDTSLDDCINQFKQEGGILITPALWEGFSQRKKTGGQLFTQLLLTRLPYKPPSELYKEVFILNYMKQSGTRNKTQAEKALYAKVAMDTLRKFRQGMGRGIRHQRDKITLWIGDPRFPTPQTANTKQAHQVFRLAIPCRFHSNYEQSLILDIKKDELRSLQQVNIEQIVL